MKNLFYYLKKNGNKTFDKYPINEVDSLIFSVISYLNIDKWANPSDEITYLRDVLKKEHAKELSYNQTCSKQHEKLASILCSYKRYENIYFKYCKNEMDHENIKQFFAVTFFIDDFMYISFRGTDLSIIGWEEDYNLAFMDVIPSQESALNYVIDVFNKEKKKMYIGGHSKGGNLVTYAYTMLPQEIKGSVIAGYSFDGPGFKSKDLFLSNDFNQIRDSLFTYSAHVSIIALLLNHVDDIEFLKSKGFSVFQHSPYNWHVSGSTLTRVKSNTVDSKIFNKIIVEFMNQTTEAERKRFGKIFFFLIKENPKASFLDAKRHPIKYFRAVKLRKKMLTKEERTFYNGIFKKVRLSIRNVIKTAVFSKKSEN